MRASVAKEVAFIVKRHFCVKKDDDLRVQQSELEVARVSRVKFGGESKGVSQRGVLFRLAKLLREEKVVHRPNS